MTDSRWATLKRYLCLLPAEGLDEKARAMQTTPCAEAPPPQHPVQPGPPDWGWTGASPPPPHPAPPASRREGQFLRQDPRHFAPALVCLREAGVPRRKAGPKWSPSRLSPARLCPFWLTLSSTYMCQMLRWVLYLRNHLKSPQQSWTLEGESISPLDALTNNNMT